jgi:hypothetical protein
MIVFLEAILHSTNTFFAVSRPVFTDETDTYVNKVAPTARIYLHLICRKRFFRGASALIRIRFLRQPDRKLPTKPSQRNGQAVPYTVQPKFCTSIAKSYLVRGTHGFHRIHRSGNRNNCIRRCGKSPLKKPVGKTRPAVLCLIRC